MQYLLFALFVLVILICLLHLVGSVLNFVVMLMNAEPIVLIVLGVLFAIAVGIAIFICNSADCHHYHSHW